MFFPDQKIHLVYHGQQLREGQGQSQDKILRGCRDKKKYNI